MTDPVVGVPALSDDGADGLARRCAERMLADDPASQAAGMRLVDVAAGRAVMAMTVRPDMLNGHGDCHGGALFSFADSAFAVACNTYDEVTVAAGADITFTAPVAAGSRLTATAVERYRRGRSGLYDVTVTGADGAVVAEFRGRSRSLRRPLLAGRDAAGG